MKRIYLQKAKAQIARPNTIRDINKQIVLNYVRERSPISRADIARETELQRSTVSAIIDDLESLGFIEEIGAGSSTGGRKPTLLKLKTGTPSAIGVDVTPKITTIAVADLTGAVLLKEAFPTAHDMEFMSQKIIEKVVSFIAKFPNADLEIGICVPGIADQITGKVLHIPYFKWTDWEIARQISEKTNLPVIIDNDANAVALAELWFGRESTRRISNFITVLVGAGIGTGVVFEGQVYRGEKGAAGEFGHMIVGFDAPVRCSCGSYDCWEGHASETAAIARFQKIARNSGNSLICNNGEIDLPYILKLANAGDESALQTVKETAKFLGIGISNLIVGLSPQAVIVSGSITQSWELISAELHHIAERSVRRDLPKTLLMPSLLGENPTLIGALSLVLARKFASAT